MMRTYLLQDYDMDNFKAHTHPVDAIIRANADWEEVQNVIYEVKAEHPDDYNSDDIEYAICDHGWDIEWVDSGCLVEW